MITHQILNYDDVVATWAAESARERARDPDSARQATAFSDAALALLSQGKSVSREAVARESGLSPTEVEKIFTELKRQGGEFNEDNDLVGLALTLIPTPHRFLVEDQVLYTWCALDAIFLPGLLNKKAQVESTCPVTERKIQLTITPSGVTQVSPSSTVLSIAVPGFSCRRDAGSGGRPQTGPASESCSQMFFFADRNAGNKWLTAHPGVVLFTPEEAYRLAVVNWLSPRKQAVSTAVSRAAAGGAPICSCC